MPVFSRGSFGGPNVLLDGVYSFNTYKPRSLFVEHRHANSADPESPLCAYRVRRFFQNIIKNGKYKPTILKTRIDRFNRQEWEFHSA